ncbi:MAG: S8 family serine peptidase [bacterium]|nr:S8 family serine peptidase [bacterium]
MNISIPSSVRSRRTCAIVVLALICSLAASVVSAGEVRWRNGGASLAPRMTGLEVQEKLQQLAGRESRRRVILHFDGPLDEVGKRALERSGITVLDYLGDNVWFAGVAKNADVARAVADTRPAAVESIPTVRKLHPDLAAGIVRPWSIIGPSVEETKGKPERPAGEATVAAYVLFHRDFDVQRDAESVIARHGGQIRSKLNSINGVVVHLQAARIPQLAAEDDVMYVEPPLPRFDEINDDNRPRTGADTANQPPYGLDGTGVTVMVYDGGQMFAHGDFAGRLTAGDTDGVSDHATHVGGTIGGDGAGSGGQYRGMAPGVSIVSYGFEQEGGLQEGFLYTDPGDLEADYTEAITVFGADISNNSIGTNTAPNGFPCEWEGNYGTTGALIDSIVAGAIGAPFRIVWANGNERQGSQRCGATYVTTAPPACAKNHITVGALNSNDDSVTGFTSWGPCDDGRIKPDISAPGCQSDGDSGVTSTSSAGGYTVKCGTSMASPTVTGLGALLLQHYRTTFPGQPDFRNSTLKAVLAQTAVDIEETGPDYKSGYGSVRVVPAADLFTEERFIEQEVAQGDVYSFIVSVGPTDTELKVTVAWDDPSGTPNVDPVLVNDLDLRVIGPDSTVHHPWTLDPANPSTPAVRNQRDGVNNIEQVVIDAPAPGSYRVEVEGFNVAQGPTQPFSAAASPTLFNCSSKGTIAARGNTIACEASLEISVIDCDLDLDSGISETIVVPVVSTTDGSGESLTLTETAPESANFEGLVTVSATEGPGLLQVAEGDTITTTYVDADDGEGNFNVVVTDDLTVDCTAPETLSVAIIEIMPRDATVQVTLDEPSQVTLHYGESCAALTETVGGGASNTLHEINIRGLTDETSYWFTVEATDPAGNVSTDDNGGACFNFATPAVPDFYTESFVGGFDLANTSITFVPNNSDDFYALCVESQVTVLPTDPTGGTDLGLGDDPAGSFTLSGGASVLHYGQAYDEIFVGPNGFVTFDVGDSDYTETLEDHFDQPRIAALWDDLNPSAGGSVSWLQLSDRAVVTWQDVPEYSESNSNTFQIEMFFDGTLRITWLSIDSGDNLVGLSGGLGIDPDFLPTDLSETGVCNPRAPFANDMAVQTGVDAPVQVALTASDDGLPEIPGMLSYEIVALPVFGSLVDDGTASPIVSVPHALQPGANSVTYTPGAGMQGADYFDFRASDGGSAPDGGTSNDGTVGVTIGGSQGLIYDFLVDDQDPGWTATGEWAFGAPTGGGTHDGDPAGGATGSNVLGYNLSGDYPNSMSIEMLTSKAINLTGRSGVHLEFQRWLGIESSTYDHATVQVSNNEVDWTTVWDHSGGALSESAWSAQSYDISAVADNQPAVLLRWTMGTSDGSVTYPGWNIDDIRILGDQPSPCFQPPVDVPNLILLSDKQTLSWDASAYAGGNPPLYDVLRADSATGFGLAFCVESDDGVDTQAVDVDDPAVGATRYYLIRAENDCGPGTLGQNSAGAQRSGLDCTP